MGGALSKPGVKDRTSSTISTKQVTTRDRPSEFDAMFSEFMGQYLGIDPNLQNQINSIDKSIQMAKAGLLSGTPAQYYGAMAIIGKLEEKKRKLQAEMNANAGPGYKEMLDSAYAERGEADKQYIDAISRVMQPHSGLLSEIINKQMAGEAVGPYGADIDKLLGERTSISFGGGDPMQFITGSQQRLLSDLLQSQLLGLGQIKDFSKERAMADLEPAQKAFDLFRPSNSSELAYMQDLRSLIEPMEYARMGVTPSVGGSSSQTMSPLDASKMQIDMGSTAMNSANETASTVMDMIMSMKGMKGGGGG